MEIDYSGRLISCWSVNALERLHPGSSDPGAVICASASIDPKLISCRQKLTWKSRQADVDTCRMKGKHKVTFRQGSLTFMNI